MEEGSGTYEEERSGEDRCGGQSPCQRLPTPPTKLLLVIHAFGGHPGKFWYRKLADSVQATHPTAEVKILRMTQPSVPVIEEWVNDLERYLQDATACGRQLDVYLIGHSVGCQTIIRYLALEHASETFTGGRATLRLGAVICVAGWFEVVNPWPTIQPWCTTPIDCATARQLLLTFGTPLVLVISDNDKYTPDYHLNASQWSTRLGAKVEIIAGRQHFGSRNQVALLDIIHEAIMA